MESAFGESREWNEYWMRDGRHVVGEAIGH